ncbi:MAG: ABC transporter ATP-binding protein [Acidobacteriota bacterium]|nr:ABC transporter ATP-binding protein [Acidobacteriota bacterium]
MSSNERQGLRISALGKTYRGGVVANADIDLQVAPGEIYGLMGPNGAGKTTLVKRIIGLLKPTEGSIHLDGHDLVADPARARQLCAYLPQGQMPIDSLKLAEAIELAGRIRGGDRASRRERTARLIDKLELEEWRTTIGMKLSGGVRRLVGFAMATVWPARVVILDEPTNDIDPSGNRLLMIQREATGETAQLNLVFNWFEEPNNISP